MKLVALAGLLIREEDPHAAIEEGQLLKPLVERVVRELGSLEDLRIGLERGFGADLAAAANARHGADRHAALVLLLVNVAIAADLDLAPLAEEVDHGDADAVQTAGGLIGVFGEL